MAESHLLKESSLLKFSSVPLIGGSGPLMHTLMSLREVSVQSRAEKFIFSNSDCFSSVSHVPVCKIRVFTVGCALTRSKILSFMSETVSLGKQSTFAFLCLILFTSFKAASPTIRISGAISPCSCILFEVLLTLLGVTLS